MYEQWLLKIIVVLNLHKIAVKCNSPIRTVRTFKWLKIDKTSFNCNNASPNYVETSREIFDDVTFIFIDGVRVVLLAIPSVKTISLKVLPFWFSSSFLGLIQFQFCTWKLTCKNNNWTANSRMWLEGYIKVLLIEFTANQDE